MRRLGRSGLPITFATVAAVAIGTLSLALPAQAHVEPAPGGQAGIIRTALTTKAPYEPEGTVRSYQQAPAGFQPVFTENVSRHGDRTLTSSSEGDSLLALWQIAQADGALTRLGQGLGPEVQQLQAANAAIGYGNLAPDGAQQLASAAVRLEERLPGLAGAQLHPRLRGPDRRPR
jgi:hypothetical protein